MVFYKNLWWWSQEYNEFKEDEKKIPNSKYLRSSNLCSEIIFNHVLLSITFNDKFWRFQLDILHLSLQHNIRVHHEKKIQFKQHHATTFRPLTQKNMVLVYRSIILVHFTMLAPQGN